MVLTSQKDLIKLAILTVLSLIIVFLIDVNRYIFIGLFALNFFIVGVTTASIVYSKLSSNQIIRKPIQIVIFGVIFTIIDTVFTIQFLKITQRNLLIVFGIINLVLLIISAIMHRTPVNKDTEDITKEETKKIESNIPKKIKNFIKKTDTEKNIEKTNKELIYVIVILSIVTLTAILLKPFNIIPVWEALVLPFILFIPGYLIINAIRTGANEFRSLERIGIAIFVSLIISSIMGFIQAQIVGSLQMSVISVILVIFTLIICIPLYARNLKKTSKTDIYTNVTAYRLLLVITIIGVIAVIGTGLYVNSGHISQNNENVTLNLGNISNSPGSDGYYTFNSSDELNLTLNLTNNENKDMNYKIVIKVSNQTSNKTILEETKVIKGKKSEIIPFNLTMTPGKKYIQFVVYNKNNVPIKVKHLLINVNKTSDYEYNYENNYEE